jgi:hypothetical protein
MQRRVRIALERSSMQWHHDPRRRETCLLHGWPADAQQERPNNRASGHHHDGSETNGEDAATIPPARDPRCAACLAIRRRAHHRDYEGGARRDRKPPACWAKVVEGLGVIPHIGRKPWWHLLRHTCASSLVSGWWGQRWRLEDVRAVLGQSDIKTTQRYAHLTPEAVQGVAGEAHAAWEKGHAGVMASGAGSGIEPDSPSAPQRIRTSDLRLRRPSRSARFSREGRGFEASVSRLCPDVHAMDLALAVLAFEEAAEAPTG